MLDFRDLLTGETGADLLPEEFAVPSLPASPPPSRLLSPRSRPRGPARPRRKRSRPALPESVPLLAWLGRRLSAGEATVWAGPARALDALLELVYAGNALARGRVSLLEGANRFHPYRIGEWGRALGADPADVLERIRLARAFTAYQLVALVDAWGREARRHRPTLLVAHDLPALFFTEEVPEEERAPLLGHVARTLSATLRGTDVPLLLTLDGGWARFPGLAEEGPRFFDYVTVASGRGAFRLHALRDGARLSLVSRPPGQLGIEEFDPDGKEEVIGWAVPRPRTGRRSKSG